MSSPTRRHGRDELSTTLRGLRKDAGLAGQEAARQTGLSQPKISRFETGALMPTAEEVDLLCRLYRAPAATRRSLRRVAQDIREESTSARVVLQRGAWRIQERIGRIEADSATVRGFHPAIVIGLLQTRGYIRAMYEAVQSGEELERTIESRVQRQSLLDSDREFVFIMTEGALRYNLGGPEVMTGQLDHLAEATHADNARVGVISQATAASTPVLHGFHIYDARAVLLGTWTATAIVTGSRDVGDYEKHFAELEDLAAFGAPARDVISRVSRDFAVLA